MLEIIYIAISGAFLAVFFDDIIEDEMILGRYGKWVRTGDAKYKSMIGGCVYCTGVWITAGMFVFFTFVPIVWQILTILATSNLIIKALDKLNMK